MIKNITNLLRLVEERLPEAEVKLNVVTKNNNKKLNAIIIREKNDNVSPMIYIDQALAAVEENQMTLDGAADYVVAVYEKNKKDSLGVDVSKEIIRLLPDNCVFQLINASLNKELLEGVPHRRFFDLAVIYRVVVDKSQEGTATAIITNNLLELTGFTEENLYDFAYANTKRIFSFKTCSLQKLLYRMYGEEIENLFGGGQNEEEDLLYVARAELYGDAFMLYDEFLKEFAELHGSFYIIPSSIHDLVLVPKNDSISELDLDSFKAMVKEVNGTLDEEDVLSDNVYYFDAEEGKLTLPVLNEQQDMAV